MLLIIIIYVFLSYNPTRGFIGKYIKQINPRYDGTISLVGMVIYGLILAVIFLIARKMIN